jgi:hypothetical protein
MDLSRTYEIGWERGSCILPHDQCGGTLLDLSIAEVLECGTVDVSIIVEWGRYRGA